MSVILRLLEQLVKSLDPMQAQAFSEEKFQAVMLIIESLSVVHDLEQKLFTNPARLIQEISARLQQALDAEPVALNTLFKPEYDLTDADYDWLRYENVDLNGIVISMESFLQIEDKYQAAYQLRLLYDQLIYFTAGGNLAQ